MVSQVTNLWGLFDEDYQQNIPKKDTLTLLVNLVFWGVFEDILTKFYSSRVWVFILLYANPTTVTFWYLLFPSIHLFEYCWVLFQNTQIMSCNLSRKQLIFSMNKTNLLSICRIRGLLLLYPKSCIWKLMSFHAFHYACLLCTSICLW